MTQIQGEKLLDENNQLRQENRLLRQRVDYLLKKYFGTSSERIDPGQLELVLQGLEQAEAVDKEVSSKENRAAKDAGGKERKHKPRRKLPESVEIQEIVIDPPEVQQSAKDWRCIGQEITEELDLIPAKFIRRKYIRRKYVSRIEEDRIVIGKLPNRLIEKGIPGIGLLTHIVLSKFEDHLPLYRQEKIYHERYGVQISRKNMVDWIRQVSDWLEPIYKQMKHELLSSDYLQVDETPITYLDRDEIEGSRKGYLWSYGKPRGNVLFDWRTGRSREGPEVFLKNFNGLLQADGYSAYASLAHNREGIVLVGCWAHCRRKFVEAMDDSPRRAGLFVRWIGHLYQTERSLRKIRAGPDYRLAYRQSQNAMTVSLMEKALQLLKPKVLPQSLLGKAIHYALGQWKYLKRVTEYGQVELDNNLCENSIRPSAVGKKNWLFIGHPNAGSRTAIIYSILQSCRRHEIDPHQYLRELLTTLPNMTNHQLPDWTPASWKKKNLRLTN